MIARSAAINVMIGAARKAARGLLRDFGEVEQLQVSKKGPGDFVSAADLRVEKMLRQELQKARPDYGFLLEESGTFEGNDRHNVWVVDPLDGTTNFLHGIPHFAISIGLVRDGEPIAGVIYQPLTDEMFWAEKGNGSFVNEHRLRVSARRQLEDAVIATGIPHQGRPEHARFLRQLPAVMAATSGVRRFGSAALDLAYVAAGRYEGFWEIGLKPWDIAAGIILVKEAGGYISEIDGGHDMLESGNVLAANDHLHLPLGNLLRSAG
ncbi:inositol monophosphatase family protein [Telmatospirillum sp.]|uniref:inositol monophosphatase family protein n=1 Tax=Telmatospirillum sp. TaxID=2079197 RepID=UPI00284FBBBE|nr:inositol monophosphatase family protein [Telmatospirillum sp.]MDR3437996.1 inositol monophosphatase family protein [Telmatospirillum sp.]